MVPCRRVSAIGDGAFPVGEKEILRREAGKLAALERVGLGVFYAGLDLAFVSRHPGFGRQQRGAVVFAEGAQLRIELGVEPVGLEDRGLQIIGDEGGG